jgi:hypothetical protein
MYGYRWYHVAALIHVLIFGICTLQAQDTNQAPKRAKEFDLGAGQKWLDTEMDLQVGDTLRITATGKIRYPSSKENGPEGLARSWRDLLRILPLNDANRGAVIGRIGSGEAARPFLIGPTRESRASTAGRLFIGLNQAEKEKPEGLFKVKVEIVPRVAAPAPVDTSKLPNLTQAMLDQIPIRVQDPEGTPGDRVSFLIIGPEEKMKRSLESAGWTQVNKSVKDAGIQVALATFSRQAYTQMPMSILHLFDRPQDFGYAMADPLTVVASRHHFRLWKAPFAVDGQTLWVGAGTHDIGFDKDQRNGKITHKIDPDTDKEREFTGSSLEGSGQVAKIFYMTPAQPLTKAKTAHGEEFFSDGRVLVVILNPDTSDLSEVFTGLFCSVLREKNPDGGEWGDCSQYLETSSKQQIALGPIPNKYRILIVPGLMNTCFSGAPAYKEGQAYLKEKHGLTVELLPLPNDKSENNAKIIADYLRGKMKEDSRKYLVLGYSKGAPDTQVALAREPDVAAAVAAFISVAGAVGGSPIADAIPGLAERWIKQYNLPNCKGDLAQALKSLSQTERHAFLSSYPDPIVPTYSLPTVSDRSNTSIMLQQAWQLLSVYASKQDSQLSKTDAIVPGSKYLGSALADHFAVALPFETSNESIRSVADKNHYPRTALLEAMIRCVIQDLDAPGGGGVPQK